MATQQAELRRTAEIQLEEVRCSFKQMSNITVEKQPRFTVSWRSSVSLGTRRSASG